MFYVIYGALHDFRNMHVIDLMYVHGFGMFFMHVTCILHDNKHAHDIHVYRQQKSAIYSKNSLAVKKSATLFIMASVRKL